VRLSEPERGKESLCHDFTRGRRAGGHTLAAAIQTVMKQEPSPLFRDWQVCDQEICRIVAEEPGIQVYYQELLSAEYHSNIEDFLRELLTGESPQDLINKKIFKLIRTLAVCGKVILVGRAGCLVTRDLVLGVHVRLVAPLETRIKRMRQLLQLDEKRARATVREQDQARARLVKVYFGQDIENPLLYDAVWNTETVPVEEIARSVVAMVRDRSCHCQRERSAV
jgi:cytidylate kinase